MVAFCVYLLLCLALGGECAGLPEYFMLHVIRIMILWFAMPSLPQAIFNGTSVWTNLIIFLLVADLHQVQAQRAQSEILCTSVHTSYIDCVVATCKHTCYTCTFSQVQRSIDKFVISYNYSVTIDVWSTMANLPFEYVACITIDPLWYITHLHMYTKPI